jgi:hypothetical protein
VQCCETATFDIQSSEYSAHEVQVASSNYNTSAPHFTLTILPKTLLETFDDHFNCVSRNKGLTHFARHACQAARVEHHVVVIILVPSFHNNLRYIQPFFLSRRLPSTTPSHTIANRSNKQTAHLTHSSSTPTSLRNNFHFNFVDSAFPQSHSQACHHLADIAHETHSF